MWGCQPPHILYMVFIYISHLKPFSISFTHCVCPNALQKHRQVRQEALHCQKARWSRRVHCTCGDQCHLVFQWSFKTPLRVWKGAQKRRSFFQVVGGLFCCIKDVTGGWQVTDSLVWLCRYCRSFWCMASKASIDQSGYQSSHPLVDFPLKARSIQVRLKHVLPLMRYTSHFKVRFFFFFGWRVGCS